MRPTEWHVKDTYTDLGTWQRLSDGTQDYVAANNSDYSCVCRCMCDGKILGYAMLGKRFTINANDRGTVAMVLRILLGEMDDFEDVISRFVHGPNNGVYSAVVYHVRCVAETFEQLIAMDDGEDGEEDW